MASVSNSSEGAASPADGRFSSVALTADVSMQDSLRLVLDLAEFHQELVTAQDSLTPSLIDDLDDFCRCTASDEDFAGLARQSFPLLRGHENVLGPETTAKIVGANAGRSNPNSGLCINDVGGELMRRYFRYISAMVVRSDTQLPHDFRAEIALSLRNIFRFIDVEADPELLDLAGEAKFGHFTTSANNPKSAPSGPVTSESEHRAANPASKAPRTTTAHSKGPPPAGRETAKNIPKKSKPFTRAASKDPANTVTQTGLVNLGNTCCNNIIFQQMMSSPAFLRDIMMFGADRVSQSNPDDQKLGVELVALFKALIDGDFDASVARLYSIDEVILRHPDLQEFAKYTDAFGNITHRQQDATEVYTRIVLPCLQPYMDGLQFQTTTYFECLECGVSRQRAAVPTWNHGLKFDGKDTSEISLMQKLYESQTEIETIEIDCETCEVRTTHSKAERIGRISESAPANDLVIHATLQEWTTDGAVKTRARMPVYDGLMAVMGLRTLMRAVNIGQHKGEDVNSGHYVCYRRPSLADFARECNNDLALMQEGWKLWTLYDDSHKVVNQTMAQVEENSEPKAQYITVLLAPITTADIIVLARLATAKFHADTVAAIEADLSLSDGGMADAYVREAHLKHPESAGLPHLEQEVAKVVRGFAHQISTLGSLHPPSPHEINISDELWAELTGQSISGSDPKTIHGMAEALTRSLVRSTLAGKDLTPEEFHSSFIGGGELAQAMERLVDDGISRFENAKHKEHQAAWRTANNPNTTPPMTAPQQTQESQQIVSSPALSIRQRSSVPVSGKSARRDNTPFEIVDMLAEGQEDEEQRSAREDEPIVGSPEQVIEAEPAAGGDVESDDDSFVSLRGIFERWEAEAEPEAEAKAKAEADRLQERFELMELERAAESERVRAELLAEPEIEQRPISEIDETVVESIEEREKRERAATPGAESLNMRPRQRVRRDLEGFRDKSVDTLDLFFPYRDRIWSTTPVDPSSELPQRDPGWSATPVDPSDESSAQETEEERIARHKARGKIWKAQVRAAEGRSPRSEESSTGIPSPSAWPATQDNTGQRQLGFYEQPFLKKQRERRQIEEAFHRDRVEASRRHQETLRREKEEERARRASGQIQVPDTQEEETQTVPETQLGPALVPNSQPQKSRATNTINRLREKSSKVFRDLVRTSRTPGGWEAGFSGGPRSSGTPQESSRPKLPAVGPRRRNVPQLSSSPTPSQPPKDSTGRQLKTPEPWEGGRSSMEFTLTPAPTRQTQAQRLAEAQAQAELDTMKLLGDMRMPSAEADDGQDESSQNKSLSLGGSVHSKSPNSGSAEKDDDDDDVERSEESQRSSNQENSLPTQRGETGAPPQPPPGRDWWELDPGYQPTQQTETQTQTQTQPREEISDSESDDSMMVYW